MSRRPYRIEVNYPKKGKPKHYLVKDVMVGGKRRKIRKYLGVVQPTAGEVEAYRKQFAYDLEIKAARKKAELSYSAVKFDYLSAEEICQLEEIRFMYQRIKELMTVSEIEYYEKDFEVKYIHGTTFLEGNTLTRAEAYDLLVNSIVPHNKSLRQINEVQNFKDVIKYRNEHRGKVTLDFIKTLNALILRGIDDDAAGTFRRTNNVGIGGCHISPTPAIFIEDELKEIINKYYVNIKEGKHPFEEAILFHYNFETIHPFVDGNGRVGREILNYMLTKKGYPKLLFLGDDRELYIDALKYGNNESWGEMIKIFAHLIITQRYEILIENLKKVSVPPKKSGQLRLFDFVQS